MGNFIIEPNKREDYTGVWDNAFLWKEKNIYVMASHRLALWCWLQSEGIQKKEHTLIHIDEHMDARQWEGVGEPECFKKALSIFGKIRNLKDYESLRCPFLWKGRTTKPCITYDNFVYLAAEANLFNHFYIYSSEGEWKTDLPESKYSLNKRIENIYNLVEDIKKSNGKCIVDIDLDFFDKREGFPKKMTEDCLLKLVFSMIAKNINEISMITISLNDTPGCPLWEKRQHQLSIIKEILKMNVPIPIMI